MSNAAVAVVVVVAVAAIAGCAWGIRKALKRPDKATRAAMKKLRDEAARTVALRQTSEPLYAYGEAAAAA